jgi:hypothetical protein
MRYVPTAAVLCAKFATRPPELLSMPVRCQKLMMAGRAEATREAR